MSFCDFKYLSPPDIIENLALTRKAGANYLLNVGPTAQGGIPDYEAATLRRVGDWVGLYENVLRNARPLDGIRTTGRDFLLKAGTSYYYFAFDLTIRGNEHVTVGGGKSGPQAIAGLHRSIVSARWLDNDESLAFSQDARHGILTLDCTPYPHGTQLVVRIAELRTK